MEDLVADPVEEATVEEAVATAKEVADMATRAAAPLATKPTRS